MIAIRANVNTLNETKRALGDLQVQINAHKAEWDFYYALPRDVTVTNAGLTDVSGMTFNAKANEVWEVHVAGSSSAGNATGDIAAALVTTGTWGTGQSFWCGRHYDGSGTATQTNMTAFASGTASSSGTTINDGDAAVRPFELNFWFTMTAAGAVTFQMGNAAAASGRTSTLKAGTMLFARRLGQ